MKVAEGTPLDSNPLVIADFLCFFMTFGPLGLARLGTPSKKLGTPQNWYQNNRFDETNNFHFIAMALISISSDT